ncbi:hypothetical protein [Ectothiorhodospira sp. BSL-9]|uniref:hypothetical protein n=1 Tax=Ectothiorhodospira sp. BSL-9 TaxID=1442136 RepID=UPI0007B42FAE|nr:hypothetical protein [Ectothiorhodospira sp. BSL-9]ANB03178.1 hypothetical protein ECTOBSL9_2767 [Ectothiorhodospira sp. BSL-9]
MDNGVPRSIEVYREVSEMAPSSVHDGSQPVMVGYIAKVPYSGDQAAMQHLSETLPALVTLCVVALVTTLSAALLVILITVMTTLT